jgi:hypothetical protein
VRVSTTVSIEDMSKAVRRAGATAIERRANRYGQQMVDRVPVVLTARGINLARPANRRRSGGTRLADGWGYKVEGEARSFPILLTLTSSGDAAQLERIRMLDEGTPGHAIRAKQRRSSTGQFGKAGFLQFPAGGAVDGPPWEYAKKVNHPGSTKARGFIRQVMSDVIGTARARA